MAECLAHRREQYRELALKHELLEWFGVHGHHMADQTQPMASLLAPRSDEDMRGPSDNPLNGLAPESSHALKLGEIQMMCLSRTRIGIRGG